MRRPKVLCWRWYETKGSPAMGSFPAVPGVVVFVTGKAHEAGPGWFHVNTETGRLTMHENRILHERKYS